ncbi:MAG: glucose-6-phosphate isomerase, partial [Myxococcota bacterium]|nr:glucose-6-phosphate isomerase [Myxococcota bacterium]
VCAQISMTGCMMTVLNQLKSFRMLESLHAETASRHLLDQFVEDPTRSDRYCLSLDGLRFDFSKHRIDDRILSALVGLANECKLAEHRSKFFAGARINETEQRAVLHMALRNMSERPFHVDGADVTALVTEERQKMSRFVERIHSGAWRGYTGRRITHIVNLGIGGSDLGPAMIYEALWPYHRPDIQVSFVSNVDGTHLHQTLEGVDPETCLFIIASKSFTTQETLTNAQSARRWFLNSGASEADISRHFVALSTNTTAVTAFGIDAENMFKFWDWVGGRFSVWSVIGLSVALGIGMDHFNALLSGAHTVDQHFETAPFSENIPVIMALLGIWYVNFYGCRAHAVLPYDQGLARFAAYLQQAEMESNGKSVGRDGQRVQWATNPVVFGEPGTNGQHAFYQLLHQGTTMIPADFIVPLTPAHDLDEHHTLLLANCLAQSEALMVGRSAADVKDALSVEGLDESRIEMLAPHKVFDGNRPSSTIVLDRLDPKRLGMLVALYEHKIFTQGVIWGIYSFDQWGVELGKKLAKTIASALTDVTVSSQHDSSTTALINYVRTHQAKDHG